MARIRTIKPELPQSETIGGLSRDARLLFIQLFTIADDAGRARAASRLLASLLYPYDDDATGLIDGWLSELAAKNVIRRYEVDGSQYLEIVKWLEHQKIDRPSASRLPAFVEGSSNAREDSRRSDADLVPSTLESGPSTDVRASRFEEFWKEYPSRDGDNPKIPAQLKFDALVKTGVDPELIIAGAKRYADEMRRKDKVGTEFIAHALKWLSQQRWADVAAVSFIKSDRVVDLSKVNWDMTLKLWKGNQSIWPRGIGSEPGQPGCKCPANIIAANLIDPGTGRFVSRSLVFIHQGTQEMNAHCTEAQIQNRKPPAVFEFEEDGVVKTGAFVSQAFPNGWDSATGERIPPANSEENAA